MFRHFDVGSRPQLRMRGSWIVFAAAVAVAACHRAAPPATPRPSPATSVQVGSCASPTRDGVLGPHPRLDRADRDLNGDGVTEAIVVDRSLCTPEGNCYWNVFVVPPTGSSDCARYAGTFEGGALEPLAATGDDNMADVRGYWNVFVVPPTGSSDCARYAGTFEGGALEPLAATGDDNMADVRGYWNLHGGRLLLQSYRFLRGGYRIVDALLCKRAHDDTLECADSER
jgi:hypothetical protein